MFSDSSIDTLRSSGWYPNRRVSTEKWVSPLTSEGFSFSKESVLILEEFGGLTIKPPENSESAYGPTEILFDPVEAASGEFDVIEHWEQITGVRFSPVGEKRYGIILMLGDDGSFYSLWDDYLWLNGSSFQYAMEETLLTGKKTPVEIGKMR